MSQDTSQFKRGYVVGNHHGKWTVKTETNPEMTEAPKKLRVASIALNTKLFPGLSVLFIIGDDGEAHSVTAQKHNKKLTLSGKELREALTSKVSQLLAAGRFADALALCTMSNYSIHIDHYEDGAVSGYIFQ